MAIESMSQLIQHAKNHDDITGRCAVILTLWAHYYEKSSHYRNISVIDWGLQQGKTELDICVSYRAWDRTGMVIRGSSFPAMYLFMPIDDVEVDIKKRRRELDKKLRKEQKERDSMIQEQCDAMIEKAYAELMERRAKKHKKGTKK